jgi:hypothetical protein
MDAQQLYSLLKSLGISLDGVRAEDLNDCIMETITIKKYAGDGPSDRIDEPLEIVVIKDGKLVEE